MCYPHTLSESSRSIQEECFLPSACNGEHKGVGRVKRLCSRTIRAPGLVLPQYNASTTTGAVRKYSSTR